MTKWTVSVGDGEIVIEAVADGQVSIDIPAHRPLLAARREVEDMRLKLGAAISDTTSDAS